MKPRINEKRERGLAFRAEEVEDGIELSISSDIPYEREYGYEVLVHSPDAINLDRMQNGAAVLLDHDAKSQIGVVERVWLDGTKLRARIRFSRSVKGQEILQDIKDGIRQNVSIGYAVNKWDKPQTRELLNGIPVFRAERWTPHEMSIVSIPADFSVGVGRAMDDDDAPEEVLPEVVQAAVEEGKETAEAAATLTDVVQTLEAALEMVVEMVDSTDESLLTQENDQSEVTPTKEEPSTLDASASGEVVAEETNADAAESLDEEKADRSTTTTSAHIRRISVMENSMKINQDEVRAANIQLSEKEHKEYSLSRAVLNLAEGKRDGFEFEVSQEIARQTGRESSGLFIPTSIRAYSIGDASTAGAFTFTQGGAFIDYLRNKAVVARLGATVMSLNSKVALPRATSDLTATWIAEDGTGATINSQSMAQVTLSPKKLATYTGFTREALTVGSLDIESMLRNNIYASFTTAFDKAAIQGTGTNQPTGLLNMTGLASGSASGSALTYANATELWGVVAAANADAGHLAYLTTAAIKAKAMSTIRSGSNADFIVSDLEKIGLYDVSHSGNVSTGYLIFGDWTSLLLAEFGAIDIVVDPYTSKQKGIIEIGATMLADVNVRTLASFAVQKNLV